MGTNVPDRGGCVPRLRFGLVVVRSALLDGVGLAFGMRGGFDGLPPALVESIEEHAPHRLDAHLGPGRRLVAAAEVAPQHADELPGRLRHPDRRQPRRAGAVVAEEQDGLVIAAGRAVAMGADGFEQLAHELLRMRRIEPAHQFKQALFSELPARAVGRFDERIGVDQHHVAGVEAHAELPVAGGLGDAEGKIHQPVLRRFIRRFEHAPRARCGPPDERARMAGVAGGEKVGGRPVGGDERGGEAAVVADGLELAVHRLDEARLVEVVRVAQHERAQARRGVLDGGAVAADIGDEHARDAPGGAARKVVDVPASGFASLGLGAIRAAVDPGVEAGHGDGVVDGAVAAPDLHALHAVGISGSDL